MRIVLHNQTESQATSHKGEVFFECARCRQIKPVHKDLGTGYATRPDGSLACYACCGQTDALDMLAEGKATLYLSKDADGWKITNWPGSLSIKPSVVKPMRHPFARQAYVAYFRFRGQEWSAKNIGDNQIAHCRRLKA